MPFHHVRVHVYVKKSFVLAEGFEPPLNPF